MTIIVSDAVVDRFGTIFKEAVDSIDTKAIYSLRNEEREILAAVTNAWIDKLNIITSLSSLSRDVLESEIGIEVHLIPIQKEPEVIVVDPTSTIG